MSAETTRETLERILAESREIRGVSLWQDAWNRLRRKRTAMVSLSCLILLATLALLTPLLPLQSPIDKDLDNRQFLSPNFGSVVMGSRPGLKFTGGTLTGELAAFDESIKTLRTEFDPTSDAERQSVATECALRLKIQMPVVVDPIDDEIARAYGALPDRLYLIDKGGKVAYQGGPGPFGFKPKELETAIQSLFD
jgi:hypothetical protein